MREDPEQIRILQKINYTLGINSVILEATLNILGEKQQSLITFQ